MNKVLLKILLCAVVLLTVAGCSTTKHVPDGEMLLDEVKVQLDGDADVETSELVNYLRQTPNHKVLGFAKLQLGTYNLSGKDTTKWYNRWLRRIGQAPVIYDQELMEASKRQLQLAMVNKGYMDAEVTVNSVAKHDKKKIKLSYNITPGKPHRISSIDYEIADSAIKSIIMADSALLSLEPGMIFDRNLLDNERTRITERLRNRGYFAFAKDYITFIADTAENSLDIDLTMVVNPPRKQNATNSLLVGGLQMDSTATHERYVINRVVFVAEGTSPGIVPVSELKSKCDTVNYQNITVIYADGDDHYINPSSLNDKCFLQPGQFYRAALVDRTYEALAQLGILKSINIEFEQLPTIDGVERLNAYIYLTRNKKQNVSFEVEGTNSEGDFGFGLGLNYQHRDLGNRSNQLNTKFRVNYESLSGNLSDLINDRYTEYAGEVGITFPKFMFPFMSREFKLRQKASTEFALSFNYQERPEYTRIIAGGAWKYKWGSRDNRVRRTFDLIDINYVYLPESTIDFINQIAPTNPLLRYSYEDHFIMRTGYTYNRTNRRILTPTPGRISFQRRIYSLRASVETAGNLLYALSSIDGQHREDGVYKIFGIQYAQYAKAEFDYSEARHFNTRHSLAFHAGAGVGVPYGNSRVMPFEKRFYAGGANSVRGWNVRTLGPGGFDSRNTVTDFINQCGDIRLDLSLEYRAKLFWVFEGAAFIDAGNIWTIHAYENQPDGLFRFSTFWKQIAWSYGLGLRMDFTYFLLRFDLGIKAYNPATNQERWPLIHPRWKRDTAFHFAVGYPF
ncbi:MAG: BamA/TamA family outer membrane protein [Firmicutes bacterium]|nr:BamA/TamA family outer membrane protein [Bacillota bacterium]MCM1402058.1 BamA/TamA family outer membrane protein [Bacteroides sp.]MCM1477982.1 BamA/TamA family outer membrane protein [Bacteroides sp.]